MSRKKDILGHNESNQMEIEDLDKNIFVFGKTGYGKSTLLHKLALQRIREGDKVFFTSRDTGDLKEILERVPDEKLPEVALLQIDCNKNISQIDNEIRGNNTILFDTSRVPLPYMDDTIRKTCQVVDENLEEDCQEHFFFDDFGKYSSSYESILPLMDSMRVVLCCQHPNYLKSSTRECLLDKIDLICLMSLTEHDELKLQDYDYKDLPSMPHRAYMSGEIFDVAAPSNTNRHISDINEI